MNKDMNNETNKVLSKEKNKETNKAENENQYKNTLNLPSTEFPMKANLSTREPIILKSWQENTLYQTIQSKTQKKPPFIFHNGPPYANGQIHLGHALNYVLKDMVCKSKLFSGFRAPFVPGWDCHGLPIELNVEKKVGKPNDKIDAKTFRKKCREYALTQIDVQREAFIRLGVLADWYNPYLTMDYQYEADIVRALAKIIDKGFLHKGYKPVHWCIDCGSALAEAEVEYRDKTSPSIDVLFQVLEVEKLPFQTLKSNKEFNLKNKNIYIVIWTTTPWTLPANEAVAVHPEHEYVLLKFKQKDEEEKYIIVAEELKDDFMKRLQVEDDEVLDKTLGSELLGIKCQHPFLDRQVPIVLGDHVTLDAGTGAVHTAPAHGQDDFIIGEKYHLPLDNPVGSNGCYVKGTPLLEGMHVLKANDKIIDILKEHHALLHIETIQHSYPHCWRHKTPLIFRATQQWFIGMEQNDLRKNSLRSIREVTWIPSWGQARIELMIEGRPDWCISRQRTWGTPLCLFLRKDNGNLHPKTPELMEKVASAIEKNGIDAWYDIALEDILGEEAKDYEKSMDTLDVWFDSGVSHFCVLERREDLSFPADLYLEGSDQHRGWFQSSLLTSVAMNNQAPYRQVLTHGFTVDADGHKMSKSLGNTVAPEKVIQNLGADVLRLWVAATDYRAEIAVSDEILKRTSDIYRRIRNTARYLLANINDFNPNENAVSDNALVALDGWIVNRAKALQKEIIDAYESYQFHLVYQKLHHFCSIDLGSFYLDVIKDRQYTGKKGGVPRRSAQTVMYHIIEALVRWMAPILTFTAEEIWQYLPKTSELASFAEKRDVSVFLTEWYQDFPKYQPLNGMDDEFWQTVLSVRSSVNVALEMARNQKIIGSGLDAEVILFCPPKIDEILSRFGSELHFVLITSGSKIEKIDNWEEWEKIEKPKHQHPCVTFLDENLGFHTVVKASEFSKCVRCWHHREDVNANSEYPELCGRCIENVAGSGEKRQFA